MSGKLLPKHKLKLLIGSLAILAVIILLGWLTFRDYLIYVDDWLAQLGYWSIPAFLGIYLLATLVGLPAIFLFLAAGSLFGFNKGVFLVSLADTLSASACYGLGRTIARKRIKQWLIKRPQFAQLDHAVAQKGWKIVFLTRLSPFLPSNILNYGFSLTRIDFWHYIFFSWLGMLPVIGLYVYLGSVGTNLIKGEANRGTMALSVVGILATIAVLLYTTKLTRQVLSSQFNSSKKK
ncbi:SNARE associated Golgi family protein [Stanieria cyanosphaera PCC 7437]|uniref:TVP38/TMEM64 family membrane protein n=1 Tax=Stanieria cyanosphaera (strain ATCC 29371 / PCC 7437) TaxID=111780 RepID=K9XXR1_STAC7|nr:TVP38/TMEM64 family protein [Stanieria cyanosphaera]AFZ36447.1 SNARE associated Golgi family protein [Stanieria cyanosphaera PCC 7437]